MEIRKNVIMKTKTSLLIALLLVVVGITGRLLPHLPNFTPITAIALFSTTYLSLRYSATIFFITMLVADIFIGFYQWQMMVAVYGSFLLAACIGLLVRKRTSLGTIVVATVSASVSFFLITNWAVWQFGTMYEHSYFGLMQSYSMAIPFFRYSLAGDLMYTGLLFGLVYVARSYYVQSLLREDWLSPYPPTVL
ncbi:MAG: hypothetical protein K0S38_226 [Candidatus Paceibacter sp.]|jgi:hypothetical protein|nr:hypothetical protein [Candidatus Paceibacter sp.]